MPAGFAAGVISTNRFVQNGRYGSISPAPASWSPYLVLAPANTSAGAPCSICAASWSVPAKENRKVTPGWAAVKARPIRGKTV